MNTITLSGHDITLFTEECHKNMVCTEEYNDHNEYKAYVSFVMQDGNTFEALVRFTQPTSSSFEPDVNATNTELLGPITIDEFAELGVFTENGYEDVNVEPLVEAFNNLHVMSCAMSHNIANTDYSKTIMEHNAMGRLLKQVV